MSKYIFDKWQVRFWERVWKVVNSYNENICSLWWTPATEATKCPFEFWPTDNRPGLRMILVAPSSLLSSCMFPPLPSLFMVGSAGLLLVRHNKVSVELLQEEKVVEGGGGQGVKMDDSHGNQLLLWAHRSPVVRATWQISPKQLSTRHLDTFYCAKCNVFYCLLSLLWWCCVTL